MATKTINLTGAEVAVAGLDGAHAHIRNDGTEVIYAAKTAGITAGADGVASIPAGQSDTIRGISGAVYLLGTGSVLIQSDDYVTSPFKTSVTLGSVTAEIVRAVSNKNYLDNPDFRVNQYDTSGTITDSGYFIDRWKLTAGSVTINSDKTLTLNGTMVQILENAVGVDVTASSNAGTASYDNNTKTFTLTASGEKISWTKLEIGTIATPFVPPDPATELAKCQRYYYKFIHSNPQNSTDNCTIGEAFALNSNTIIAIIPVPAMRHGVYSSVDYKNVQLVKGVDEKTMYDGNIVALEQTDSTIQLVFATTNQTAGDRYRVRLIGSDAYIALNKEI